MPTDKNPPNFWAVLTLLGVALTLLTYCNPAPAQTYESYQEQQLEQMRQQTEIMQRMEFEQIRQRTERDIQENNRYWDQYQRDQRRRNDDGYYRGPIRQYK